MIDLSDPEIDGETLIEFILPFRFRSRAHKELAVELGAIIGHNFGDDDDIDIFEPLFRLGYEPVANICLIGGTIFPTHWIHDAIYDDVTKFRTNAEQGFPFRSDMKQLKEDLWRNWKVRENELDPEESVVDNSTQYRILDEALWFDGQSMWTHTGGQKNISPR